MRNLLRFARIILGLLVVVATIAATDIRPAFASQEVSRSCDIVALSSNYTMTYIAANLTINKKAALVTPDTAGKAFGAVDPVFSGTLSGFLASDGIVAVYSRAAGENVGTYTISAALSPAGVLGNYSINYNIATFTIIYGFNGLLNPYSPTKVNKAGSSIPLKWQYTDSSGKAVNSTSASRLSPFLWAAIP